MRIHLGHHFYGAGNLGDDFMLAGFRSAMRELAPGAEFTSCVPFSREALAQRFPEIRWLPYTETDRARAIAACDVWLGLGGSPFQSGQSRWFVDHLVTEAALCARAQKPMFFLGVGVQERNELADPDVRRICAQAAAIWTRDAAAADWLRALPGAPPVEAAADLAHIFFRATPPPGATRGRVTLVANFDFAAWPGQGACLAALADLAVSERVWLCQETRDLPGAERALFAALPSDVQTQWKLISPDVAGAPLERVLAAWPGGEWLVTSRYHAALAGAWAGSKIVVLATNEKLRGAARELGVPFISVDADVDTTRDAVRSAESAVAASASERTDHRSLALAATAARAHAACAAFVRSAVAQRR